MMVTIGSISASEGKFNFLDKTKGDVCIMHGPIKE